MPIQAAFLHGSSAWLGANDDLQPGSDIDILLVPRIGNSIESPGKQFNHGVMLEPSVIRREEVASTEAVLSAYHLAGSLRLPELILFDEGGWLRPI